MKKLLAILTAITLFSCGGNEEPFTPTEPPMPENPKEYIVSLGFSGEITNIEESPLSRAVSNDLYGIQVYSMPATETDQSKYKPYAYGLFDDKANMSVKLLEGYKYKFASTMVADGKNKVGGYNNGYSFPFYTGDATAKLGNAFIYSSSSSMGGLSSGSTATISATGNIYEVSKTDRYYGESANYIPSQSGSVSIGMKRTSFGIKIITEGFADGKIAITLKEAQVFHILFPDTEIKEIFTFKNTERYSNAMAWTEDNYTETIPMSMVWEKADGAAIPLVTQDITFKRNKLTTITVKVKDNSINNGVDISNENTPMGDGGNITIDTSNGTDTGVTPNP